MPSEDDGFHVDVTFSGRSKNYAKPVATAAALVGILFVILTMVTGLASRILPMNDQYLQVLVPVAADGGEPLSLLSLEHEVNGKTITVRGTVVNRTEFPIANVIAVVEVQETTGRFPQTVEAPIQPVELLPNQAGQFMLSATLQEKPAGYFVKFQLADGPFIPHRDDRTTTYGVTEK